MDEIVEILTEDGQKTGEMIKKVEAHNNGICHGISVIALINNEGKLLIQKRAKNKKTEPGKWDLSAAGHIDGGESPKKAALREANEEIGINLNEKDLMLIDTYLCKKKLNENIFINHYTYLFVVKVDIDIDVVIKQTSEVEDIKFVNIREYKNLYNNDDMVEGTKYCYKILDYMK